MIAFLFEDDEGFTFKRWFESWEHAEGYARDNEIKLLGEFVEEGVVHSAEMQ